MYRSLDNSIRRPYQVHETRSNDYWLTSFVDMSGSRIVLIIHRSAKWCSSLASMTASLGEYRSIISRTDARCCVCSLISSLLYELLREDASASSLSSLICAYLGYAVICSVYMHMRSEEVNKRSDFVITSKFYDPSDLCQIFEVYNLRTTTTLESLWNRSLKIV